MANEKLGYHEIAKELCKVDVPLTVGMIQKLFKVEEKSKIQNVLSNIDKCPEYNLDKTRTGMFKTYVVREAGKQKEHQLWRLAIFGEQLNERN